MNRNILAHLLSGLLLLSFVAACGAAPPRIDGTDPALLSPVPLEQGQKLRVVATTNIVGDVVRNIGGDQIDLTILMGAGVDPHSYVPAPADIARVHDAHVLFANGAGLESGLAELLANAGGDAVAISLSDNLELRSLDGDDEADADHGSADPHVWFDVQYVIRWVETIAASLTALDPESAGEYSARAERYTAVLTELDAWVAQELATIPESNRILVTNHPVLGYLAARHGLQQLGAVYPISPSSEPSAQDVAALEDYIRQQGVPALFSESTVNPKLARQIAADTGVELISLYTGSLGPPGSGAETYVDLIRYDITLIVQALQ